MNARRGGRANFLRAFVSRGLQSARQRLVDVRHDPAETNGHPARVDLEFERHQAASAGIVRERAARSAIARK